MNKIKMGKFIKELRIKYCKTQYRLSQALSDRYLSISTKAISNWEKGKTIPDIDKLTELSDIFKVTIDELLDGEYKTNIDYKKEYFICNPTWDIQYPLDGSINLYNIRQEQIIKINRAFANFLKIRVNNDFSSNQESEFRFLFEHFYKLSDYYQDNDNKNINDPYLLLKSRIRKCLLDVQNMNEDEKIWELKKLLTPIQEITLNARNDFKSVPKSDSYINKRFNSLEFWEKDMILSGFQVCDFLCINPENYGSANLERYEKTNGKVFDKVKEVKDILRYLIENGACINSQYLNFIERKKEKQRIIDRLEELYHLCKEPIKGSVKIDREYKNYEVENTPKNRFIHDCYFTLHMEFDYSLDELFEFVTNKNDFTKEMVYQVARKHNIDLNRKERFIRSDVNFFLKSCTEKIEEFKNKEQDITNGLVEYNRLLSLMQNGEKYYEVNTEEFIGGNDWKELRSYCYFWNQFVTKDELFKLRKKKETKELYNEMDKLSLEEIKKKYFPKEVHANE